MTVVLTGTVGDMYRLNEEAERRKYAALSQEEKDARWRERKRYLLNWFCEQPSLAMVVDRCPNCTGIPLHPSGWPQFWRCLTCRVLIVVDRHTRYTDGNQRLIAIDLDLIQAALRQEPKEPKQ